MENSSPIIHTGPTPLALLKTMAEDLASHRDPWARHWLCLPRQGQGEWVLQHWAKITGLASRSQYVPLRSLVELAGSGAERRPYSFERLHLAVTSVIHELRNVLPLPPTVQSEGIDGKVIAWSKRLAEALDLGYLCRKDFPTTEGGLATLATSEPVKRELMGHLGNLRDEVFRDSTQEWLEGWEEKGGVPHLWIALDAGLPFHLMDKLQKMLRLFPTERVHLYLLSPSELYWADMKVGRYAREDGVSESAGPVLKSFGRCVQDLHNQAVSGWLGEGEGEINLDAEELPESLLGRLQERCRLPGDDTFSLPIEADGTFEVHSCRNVMRELEVCRDRILQAMSEDPSLRPEEILLLLSHPEDQAHLISAALQPLELRQTQIPFRLLTTEGSTSSSLKEGVLQLFDLLNGRMNQENLLTLMEHPLLVRKFGFGARVSEMFSWLQESGYRWGVDRDHRLEAQGIEEERWNLKFAIRRLALGAVVDPIARDGLIGGAAPLERARGIDVAEVAKLSSFAEKLSSARKAMFENQPRSLGAWCLETISMIDDFFDQGDAAAQQERSKLLNSVLREFGQQSPVGLEMSFSAFRRLLGDRLKNLDSDYRGGKGGGVTVASLAQYAGVPSRMVVIVGLGGDSFPRRVDRPSWHPLDKKRMSGDPDLREEDRHHLLLALLSAKEKLVITYEGGSDEDDRPRPPSTPLSDLLDAARASCSNKDDHGYHYRHGLNGFSPESHQKGNPSQRSFLKSEWVGAKSLMDRNSEPLPGLWFEGLEREPEPHPISRRDLKNVLRNPSQLFLNRLGIRIADEEDGLENGDFFELNGLQKYVLRERLITHRLSRDKDQELFARMEFAGDLPPGIHGSGVLKDLLENSPSVMEASWLKYQPSGSFELKGEDGRVRAFEAGLDLPWFRMEGTGVFYHYMNKVWDPAKRKDEEFRLQVDLFILSQMEGQLEAKVLGQNSKGPVVREYVISSPEKGGQLLMKLQTLVDLARRLPLPYDKILHSEMYALFGKEEPEHGVLLKTAYEKWHEKNQHTGLPSVMEKPTHQCVFRGLDSPTDWAGPDGYDLFPLENSKSITLSLFEWLKKWQEECREVIEEKG